MYFEVIKIDAQKLILCSDYKTTESTTENFIVKLRGDVIKF